MAHTPLYSSQNVDIALYVDNVNCNWTKPYAREALRWERRLELAMESQRFFDLVRWGIADSVINTFYKEEAPKRTYYEDAHFEKNTSRIQLYYESMIHQKYFSYHIYKEHRVMLLCDITAGLLYLYLPFSNQQMTVLCTDASISVML